MSSSNYEKLKIDELKSFLKKIPMTESGDKGTLTHRLSLNDKCIQNQLVLADGRNPCILKGGDLKKEAAKLGVSPMFTPDEMIDEIIKILIKKKQASSSSSSSSSSSTTANQTKIDPIMIAQKVLELGELDDDEGILNLTMSSIGDAERITKKSSVSIMRKAYLKLSLLIHPDKLGNTFDQATKAFQVLVRAFDRLSRPDVVDNDIFSNSNGGKSSSQPKTLARSNDGCYRTRVRCPRCKQPWNEGTLDGNPDYFYNFIMMGLKCYTCSTCLCEFGCMTALHNCPHCLSLFEYSPDDYHRKILCSNKAKCGKSFGFYMYTSSNRVLTALKDELKVEQEKRNKERVGKQSRAARANRNQAKVDEELMFIIGLSDSCPRCGYALDIVSEEEQRLHLMNCNDVKKHVEYTKQKEKVQKKIEKESVKQQTQESVEREAAFNFLGGVQNPQLLWMLDEEQIRKTAKSLNIDTNGSKDELIFNIVASTSGGGSDLKTLKYDNTNSNSSLTVQSKHGSALTESNNSNRKRRISTSILPSNIHAMSAVELRSVCACNGINPPPGAVKADLLRLLEGGLYNDDADCDNDKDAAAVDDDDSDYHDDEDEEIIDLSK